MANPIPYPMVNGTRHSWAQIEAKANGALIVGFQEINYNDKLTPEKQYGTAPEPIGRTLGEYDAEGSCTLLLAEFNVLITALGPGFKQKVFPITVSYSADGLETIVDQLIGVRIAEVDASNAKGPGGTVRKLTLNLMKILWNGLDSLVNPLTGVPA